MGLHDEIQATYYTDTQTQEILRRVLREYQYPLCPHSAIAWQAAIDCIPVATHESPTIALATAHPAKFHEVVAETIGEPVVIPESLAQFLEKRSYKTTLPAEYKSLRSYMLER